jgi:hypothetical protein
MLWRSGEEDRTTAASPEMAEVAVSRGHGYPRRLTSTKIGFIFKGENVFESGDGPLDTKQSAFALNL